MEEDKKDKRKETEELNMLKRRLAEENHTDPNSVIAKVNQRYLEKESIFYIFVLI